MEADVLSFEKDVSGRCTRLHIGNTELANAEHPAAQSISSTGVQDSQSFLGGRMAIIWKYKEKELLDEAIEKFLDQAILKSTNDAYNRDWKKLG
ncbi:hypothetical protein G6F70_009044 [Rhizopus microsporus]|nr:hypothetical protein G6F71_008877 [Rhizopus microsporus]KAG1193564.1 hypothetical protein G6F70_009044 [Rhizopus microsporus]KAG1206171.1 hypothetical protein G6F69_009025 [Rhizopus microsporus]KAG1226350.1 hypothetical protein G6F67_009014 [Rhizopus microsporus]KAG1257913.1 hypothetical protein G6F68_009069 [Rhizopus microsporus]